MSKRSDPRHANSSALDAAPLSQVGIGVVAGGADTTGVLRGDQINGTTVAPVREIQCCGFTATAIVR